MDAVQRYYYAEMFRKCAEDGLFDVAEFIRQRLGLTDAEIGLAVGGLFWAAANLAMMNHFIQGLDGGNEDPAPHGGHEDPAPNGGVHQEPLPNGGGHQEA